MRPPLRASPSITSASPASTSSASRSTRAIIAAARTGSRSATSASPRVCGCGCSVGRSPSRNAGASARNVWSVWGNASLRSHHGRTGVTIRIMRAFVVSVVLAACGGRSEVAKLADEQATVTGFAADERGVAWLAAGKDTTQLKTLVAGKVLTVANGILFNPALDGDNVYWADGEHVWRSPRSSAAPVQIGEIDDVTRSLLVTGGFVYWATNAKVGRIPLAGGPSQIVAERPPVEKFVFQRIAVDGTRIVAALGHDHEVELWQLDGEPHRIAHVTGYTDGLRVDGAAIVFARTTPTGGEVQRFDFTGANQGAPVAGMLLDAR